jgi:hypothetical protein
VKSAGGMPVPLANLLAPEFRATPELMFSADGYHPSPTAYALAAAQLLVALCDAMGEEVESPVLNLASRSSTPVLGSGHARLSAMSRLWRRPGPSSSAPSSCQPMSSD